MALHTVIRPKAAREIARQAKYLAREASPAVARRFLKAFAKSLTQLASMPELGSVYEFDNPRLSGVRVWPVQRFRNYLIFYRVNEESVEVLHLFHGSRDIEGLLEDVE